MRNVDVIVPGKQIARGAQVASRIRSGETDLRCAVERSASANHESADGLARNPSGKIDRCSSGKEVTAARKTEAKRIQDIR